MAFLIREEVGRPLIDLAGPEGNAFALMGYARRYARQLGLDEKQIISEMMSGDYENLVMTFDKYFGQYVDIVR